MRYTPFNEKQTETCNNCKASVTHVVEFNVSTNIQLSNDPRGDYGSVKFAVCKACLMKALESLPNSHFQPTEG